jgi:hypothetical protein
MNLGIRCAAAVPALLLASLLVFANAAIAADELPQTSPDGLQLVKRKNLDVLYVRPGASLTSYTKVMIDPVEVAFSKEWKPSSMDVSAEDREEIRTGLAEEFRDVFTKELQEKGGYQVVTEAGPDVLRVTAGIIDLYITAPDTDRVSPQSRSFVFSAGQMTLVGELRDSESGAILARVADRKGGQNSTRMTWATSTSNRAEARRVLAQWAGILRDALDRAKSS